MTSGDFDHMKIQLKELVKMVQLLQVSVLALKKTDARMRV
jgi:hypothetical protein